MFHIFHPILFKQFLDVLREEQPLREDRVLGEEVRRVFRTLLRNPHAFDWYQNWINLRDIVSQYTHHDDEILNIGAGNSRNSVVYSVLSEEMYKEGYRNIVNVDFSSIVVEDMQMKYKNLEYDETFECRAWVI